MKRVFVLISVILLTLFTSCTTYVQMRKTYPPEMELPADSNRYLFVNFYDYSVPGLIKNSYQKSYAAAVEGYAKGLKKIIKSDKEADFIIADTLRKGHTVISMQYPDFADTVKAICQKYGGTLLIALDSIELWIESDLYIAENDEGDGMLTKDFYLYANNYMTLYSSDGEVIDRCAGEKYEYIKSKYTIFSLIGGPTLAKTENAVMTLSEAAAMDCIGKFFPFTEYYIEKLYSGGPFNTLNNMIIAGRPEDAREQLIQLTASPSPEIARKATHNLSVVDEIIENRKTAEEIWKKYEAPPE